MSELLLKRVDELRAEKQKQQELKELQIQGQKDNEERLRIQQEQELTDAKVTWEAEMILQTEELTEKKIIEDFTDDKVPESYTQSIVPKYLGNYLGKYNWKPSNGQSLLSYPGHQHGHLDKHQRRMMVEEDTFKKNYIHDYIFNAVQPIYQERQNTLKRVAEEKEQLRRQTLINEENAKIKRSRLSGAIYHTFTDLTLSDYDNRNLYLNKEYLVHYHDNSWAHYKGMKSPIYRDEYPYDAQQHKMGTIYDMPSSWLTYYEEGKVPFCTKCPFCKNPTKLNYLVNIYNNGWGVSNIHVDGKFTEVFCDKHYKYDCETDKHYKMDLRGKHYNCRIRSKHVVNPNLFSNHSTTKVTTEWDPTGKWLEWDPADPDALERKQKEIEDITKQIAELQTKLAILKS